MFRFIGGSVRLPAKAGEAPDLQKRAVALRSHLQSTFPFQQSWVRIIKAAVERMEREIGQVVFRQFAERFNHRLRLSHCHTGKCVRLVFETARPDVKQRRKPKTDCPAQHGEQHYGGNEMCDGKASLISKTKGAIKPLL